MDVASGTEDPLAVLYLDRLRHLVELDRTLDSADVDPRERQFVHKAIFSTWLDCKDIGLGAEAAELMGSPGRFAGPTATGVGGA
jgi:hypothetical protein